MTVKQKLVFGFLLLVVGLLISCASWNKDAGVDNRWRAGDVPTWVVGQTVDKDVMEYLGPPSQIISLKDETVYYYLKENISGKGFMLLVYSRADVKTSYDRAIFFFDAKGVLTRFSYSNEELDHTD